MPCAKWSGNIDELDRAGAKGSASRQRRRARTLKWRLTIILDPPRAGLHEKSYKTPRTRHPAHNIPQLQPCHARDVAMLADNMASATTVATISSHIRRILSILVVLDLKQRLTKGVSVLHFSYICAIIEIVHDTPSLRRIIVEALFVILLVCSLATNGWLLSKKLHKSGKSNDSFVLAAAYGKLVKPSTQPQGQPGAPDRAIEEIKGNRTTEIQFMREQYQACLDGIKHAGKEHLDYIRTGYPPLADR